MPMPIRLPFAVLILLIVTATVTAEPPADPTLGAIGADLCAAGKVALFTDGALPQTATEAATDPNLNTDVLHNDIAIEIDPAAQTLAGSNTMTVRSLVDGLTTFDVRIRSQFNLPSVLVDGAPASWTRQSTTTITITLPVTKNTGDTFTVTVSYDGPAVNVGFGSINFDTHAGTDVVFTLSEPWYAYSWWPNKDDNRDKATADIRITTPDWMTVAANGVLQSETNIAGARKVTHWSTAIPMTTYLHSFAATNYTKFTDTYTYPGGSMPLEFFVYPEFDTTSNRNKWLEVKTMLDVFGQLYGPYPFLSEKYGLYQFGFGGGMEHQTMTGEGGFGESLTAHELSHQWWGDNVTTADWSNIWLNEGFATYSEALWAEFKPGGTAADLHAAMAARVPTSFNDSTFIPNPTDPNRIFSTNFTYRKGAWILHMLRHVVGDQAFFDSLAAYRAANQLGSATTDDFRLAVESVTGTPMDWFFTEWVFDVGAPWYEHAFTEHLVNGQRYAEVLIRQASPTNYPLFTMPIDLGVDTSASSTVAVVTNDAPAEHFLLPIDGSLQNVRFDPDTWILAENDTAITFTEGPPKIIARSISPGASVAPSAPMTVTFHKPVSITGSNVALVGPAGPIATTVSYDAPSQTATITPTQTLAPGAWTLTILDTVTDLASSQNLDGEIGLAAPAGPLGGDGVAGGDAVIPFTVTGSVADINGDGVVDGADLAFVLSAWGACVPAQPCPADLTGDGLIDGADIAFLLSAWG